MATNDPFRYPYSRTARIALYLELGCQKMRWWIVGLSVTMFACGSSPTTPTTMPFTGHWVGSYVVRQCVPVGWPSCEGLLEQVGQSIRWICRSAKLVRVSRACCR